MRPSHPKIDASPCDATEFSRTQTQNPSVLEQEIRPSDENCKKTILAKSSDTKSAGNPAATDGQGSAPEPDSRRPAARCKICSQPYGRHYWRDSYGFWRCTQCHPPAATVMVRDQVLVPVDGLSVGQSEGELALVASSDGGGEFVAGEEFPAYARGRWRYYEDRWGRHWERVTFSGEVKK